MITMTYTINAKHDRAVTIEPRHNIGIGVLIAEFADGKYEVANTPGSISEAEEMMDWNKLRYGHAVRFILKARNYDGAYATLATWAVK